MLILVLQSLVWLLLILFVVEEKHCNIPFLLCAHRYKNLSVLVEALKFKHVLAINGNFQVLLAMGLVNFVVLVVFGIRKGGKYHSTMEVCVVLFICVILKGLV